MLLELEELHTSFGSGDDAVKAVDGVSFGVREGEIKALVGESGSGKTVTAESITRITEGDISGGIRYRGRGVLNMTDRELRELRGGEIAHVFQNPDNTLNPVYTVGNQVRETLNLHRDLSKREARRDAVELLARVGIPDAAARVDDYPHEFSGGMKQRVAIANALAGRPDLLIADEPTTALDVSVQAGILDLLDELRSDLGLSILLITHDLGVVAEISDSVVVMYAGKVMEKSPTETLFEEPKHPYTVDLLDCLPGTGKGKPMEGTLPNPRDPPEGCRYHPRCRYAVEDCHTGPQPPLYTPGEILEEDIGRRGPEYSDVTELDGSQDRSESGTDTPAESEVYQGETEPSDVSGEAERVSCVYYEPGTQLDPEAIQPKSRESGGGTIDESEGEVLLEVEGLEKIYRSTGGLLRTSTREVRAVDGFDLTVREGAIHGLVGESGCGKTTAAHVILNLEEATGGEIQYRGRDVSSLSGPELKRFRRATGVLFQDPTSSFDPRMSVGESVMEPLKIHGVPIETRMPAANEKLDLVGLNPGYTDRYPHELSGGEKQRAALARALVTEPEFLIADEPVSALDVSVQAKILNLLQDLRDELGLTVLLITHDLNVVREICSDVTVMYLGENVEQGCRREVFTNPKHPYTRSLLSAVPEPDPGSGEGSQAISGELPDPSNPPEGCRFHTRCPDIIPPENLDVSTEEYRRILEFKRAAERRVSGEGKMKADPGYEEGNAMAEERTSERYGLSRTGDRELDESLEKALGYFVDGMYGDAASELGVFESVCESEVPEEFGGEHSAKCHLLEEDTE
ncbi:MAG: dipeptide ABC transporter ATP-binding protein [Halobacteria archaeon]